MRPCKICKGERLIREPVYILSTIRSWRESDPFYTPPLFVEKTCPYCEGRGYQREEDNLGSFNKIAES